MKKRILAVFMILSIAFFATSCSDNDNDLSNNNESKNSADIARGFYQDVIVSKDMTKFDKYIGNTYKQHATGYADGVEPLRTELIANSTSNNTIKILRVIGDKNYAALHSLWKIGNQQIVYVDVWRIENGKLVEHWDQYQNVPDISQNSNTMYLGPDANPNVNQNTEQNRKRAIAVLKVFDNLDDISPVQNFVSDNYIQHNPTVKDGKQEFINMLNSLKSINYKSNTTIGKTMAYGDMVVVHSKVIDTSITNDKGTGAMDIFRFDNSGKIIEHWDVLEPLTGVSLNSNDPFYYPN